MKCWGKAAEGRQYKERLTRRKKEGGSTSAQKLLEVKKHTTGVRATRVQKGRTKATEGMTERNGGGKKVRPGYKKSPYAKNQDR